MKKQTCVVHSDRTEFSNLCRDYMKDGWRVIPGTVACAAALTTVGNGSYMSASPSTVLIAFFEKEQ